MIKFNEVTWYSKLAAIIFFIGVLPGLAFYIGIQYEKTKSVNNLIMSPFALNNKVTDEPASEVNEDSELSGSLQGYYYTYTKTGEYIDQPFSEKCESFVVRTGDENGIKLKQYFTDLVNRGNAINQLSDSGDLILNLNSNDIDALNDSEKDILRKSSSTDEVIIYVKKLAQGGKDASPCHSFVDVYQVDDYQYDYQDRKKEAKYPCRTM